MVDPGSTEGSVQRGLRPVVVVSTNSVNKTSPVVIVAPTTRTIKQTRYRVDVPMPAGIISSSAGRILCSQIRTVSQTRLGRYLGRLPDWLMLDVDDALRLALDL